MEQREEHQPKPRQKSLEKYIISGQVVIELLSLGMGDVAKNIATIIFSYHLILTFIKIFIAHH